MGEMAQITGSGLYAYGWVCLLFSIISMGSAIRNEVSGRARTYDWTPRVASWMYAAACLLMAEIAWYLARVSQ
jgi:hypothetical protein